MEPSMMTQSVDGRRSRRSGSGRTAQDPSHQENCRIGQVGSSNRRCRIVFTSKPSQKARACAKARHCSIQRVRADILYLAVAETKSSSGNAQDQ